MVRGSDSDLYVFAGLKSYRFDKTRRVRIVTGRRVGRASVRKAILKDAPVASI
jgi:hypothetical protein